MTTCTKQMTTYTVKPTDYSLYTGFIHLGAGLACGFTGLAAGYAIGYVGDSVREPALPRTVGSYASRRTDSV